MFCDDHGKFEREKEREREYNVAAEVNLANECIRDGCRTIWHRITSEPPE